MTTAVPETFDLDLGFDLDAERSRRAAERAYKADSLPIRLGGNVVASIPTELPLAVLAPLRRLDDEITLLLRSVMTAMNAGVEAQERFDATSLVVDILAANPQLPTTVIDVINDMGALLMGDEGWSALLAERLTREDMTFLARHLLRFYGMTLGESRPSSPSSTEEDGNDGTTSTLTSPTTTPESTPEESGADPASPASSEPVAS